MLELQKIFNTCGLEFRIGAYTLQYIDCFRNCETDPNYKGRYWITSLKNGKYIVMTPFGILYSYSAQQLSDIIVEYNNFIKKAPWFKNNIGISSNDQLEAELATLRKDLEARTNLAKSYLQELESLKKKPYLQEIESLKKKCKGQAEALTNWNRSNIVHKEEMAKLNAENKSLQDEVARLKLLIASQPPSTCDKPVQFTEEEFAELINTYEQRAEEAEQEADHCAKELAKKEECLENIQGIYERMKTIVDKQNEILSTNK